MGLDLVQVNVKARNDSALGRFWGGGTRLGVSSEGTGATSVRPVGAGWPVPDDVCIDFCGDVIAGPDPETVQYRMHLELATTSAAHHAERVARLTDVGATPTDVDLPRTVVADLKATSSASSVGRMRS